MNPVLVDINGYSMESNLAGPQLWFVENGSVNNTGYYYASNPGLGILLSLLGQYQELEQFR